MVPMRRHKNRLRQRGDSHRTGTTSVRELAGSVHGPWNPTVGVDSVAVENVGMGRKRRLVMLSHCANSQCSKPFLRLREGRLFLVETSHFTEPARLSARAAASQRKPPQRVEHFWLCDQCAHYWTLAQDESQAIALVPLGPTTASQKGTIATPYRESI
jgi:hypothetical protein